jgi:hypothetical protein
VRHTRITAHDGFDISVVLFKYKSNPFINNKESGNGGMIKVSKQ